MFHQRRHHTIYFAKTFERPTKSCWTFPSSRKEWKKIKPSEKKRTKYKGLYEEDKQRHEEALQRHQEDHIDEVEIISLHKRCNKTKTVAKTAQKAPKSGYHLFLREQLDVMTG